MGRSFSPAYHVCLQPGTDARRDKAAPSRASCSGVGWYCELSMEDWDIFGWWFHAFCFPYFVAQALDDGERW